MLGRLVDASNATLYCAVTLDGVTATCVYKPVAGERPLWDFPDGTLAGREVAAYRVSAATGWDVVPPTVLRDGPWARACASSGSTSTRTVDLVALLRSDDARLRRMAVFDAVINNADRKGGHLLPTPDGHLYGVDHGVCFAVPRTSCAPCSGVGGAAAAGRGDRRPWTAAAAAGRATSAAICTTLLTTDEVVSRPERGSLGCCPTGVHPMPREDGWPAVPWPPF